MDPFRPSVSYPMANAHIPAVHMIGRSILTSSNGFFREIYMLKPGYIQKFIDTQAAKPQKQTEEEKSNNFNVNAQSV